ncbi:MAG: toll/interleukin-1 receptor domain-containing protein [Bacteroidales bacterium]|jgi:hypothetical protein
MKEEIFISYSDSDKEKVDLIVKELEGNTRFQSLVIASNREALKPLAKKVADGIEKAKVIVPILTKNSFMTQWINQEIGYATALNKKIIPIVEKDIIGSLKGFIHKEIDLPYNYKPNDNKAKEHKDFISCFRLLLSDLEKEYKPSSIIVETPKKTDFEKSLEQVDIVNAELDFHNKRKAFLNSPETVGIAENEVRGMFADIEEKVKKLKEKKITFGVERDEYPLTYILKSQGFSFSIAWQLKYNDNLGGSTLFVRLWLGHLSNDESKTYIPGEEPKMSNGTEYDFDRDREYNICWSSRSDKKQYTSVQIVDRCLHWLVDQVSKKRLDNR